MPIKHVDLDTLLQEVDPCLQRKVRRLLDLPGTAALVLFENGCFDSSSFGARTVVAVGPQRAIHNLEECEGRWLNDLPSQRQYPKLAYVKAEHPSDR